MKRKRYYVGLVRGSATNRKVLTCDNKPSEETHGMTYGAIIGPFRTKRGAEFMALNGWNNPHCRCVNDAERLAKLLA